MLFKKLLLLFGLVNAEKVKQNIRYEQQDGEIFFTSRLRNSSEQENYSGLSKNGLMSRVRD